MGICLIVGWSKCLPGWFGALMQWKLKFKWVFSCVKEGVKACQDALGHLSPSKWWFDKVAQIGPKIKCPRVPVWVHGGRGGVGGGQSLFGQCPKRRTDIFRGASLNMPTQKSLLQSMQIASDRGSCEIWRICFKTKHVQRTLHIIELGSFVGFTGFAGI